MPGTRRSSSGMLRAPLARISSRPSTVMLPGTSAGACFSLVALSTVGSSGGASVRAGAARAVMHRAEPATRERREIPDIWASVFQCAHGNDPSRFFHHRFAVIVDEHILSAVYTVSRNLHE